MNEPIIFPSVSINDIVGVQPMTTVGKFKVYIDYSINSEPTFEQLWMMFTSKKETLNYTYTSNLPIANYKTFNYPIISSANWLPLTSIRNYSFNLLWKYFLMSTQNEK